MLGDINQNAQVIKPTFSLAKPNGEIIAKLPEIYNVQQTIKFGSINELSFNIPLQVDINHVLQDNPNIVKLKNRYLIKVTLGSQSEWYIITKIQDSADESSDVKTVTAFSLGYELKDKIIRGWSATSINATTALTTVLSDTIWSINYVNANFDTVYRSFDISSATVLDTIFKIADTFGAVVQFDTETRTVSLYNENELGTDKGLTINYGKYLQALNKEEDTDTMVTRLRVYGRDGLSIQRVNPTGQPYIEDLSYFMSTDYMSSGLITAINNYNSLLQTKTGEFNTLLSQKETLETTLTTQQNTLTTLQDELAVILDDIDITKSKNDQYNASTTYNPGDKVMYQDVPYECILQTTGNPPTNSTYWESLYTRRDNKQTEINTKQSEIDTTNADIASVTITITVNTGATTGGNITFNVDGNTVTVTLAGGDTANTVASKIDTAFNTKYPTYKSSVSTNIVTVTYYTTKDQGGFTVTFTDTGSTGVTASISKVNRGVDNNITKLRSDLSIENNFTPSQITERNQFIIEKEWVDENYIDDQELYNAAVQKFNELKLPKTVLDIDIVNFLEIVECQNDWDKLNIGDTIHIFYPKFNIAVDAKIIEIEFDYENADVNLVIANVKDILTDQDRFLKKLHDSISTSTTVNMQKYKWNKVEDNETQIDQIINNKWSAIERGIVAGVNESITIDRRGIRITDPSDPNNMLIAQHSVIALSSTGGQDWKHAITPQGIVAENIYGKLGTFATVAANQIVVGSNNEKITDGLIESSTNWNDTYTGTINYRTTGAPTNAPIPTAIDIDTNTDGSIDIKISWDTYVQGAKQADMLLLFWKKGTTSGLGAPTVDDACIAFNVNTINPSFYTFEGVASDKYYSFGLAAARRTENGLEVGEIVSLHSDGTFDRPSNAYKQDGTEVAADQPRFEASLFGQGLMFEEGTNNLVKTNAGATADFSDSVGWTLDGLGTSIANGVATLKSPDGVAVSMVRCTLTNLVQNTPHSFLIRARYKDTTGTPSYLVVDLQASGYDDAEQELFINSSSLTTTFQNFTKDGFDSQSAPSSVYLRIFTFSTRPIEVEFIQLEQKPFATSFIDSTRSPETLTIPANVFTKGSWQVDMVFTPTSKTDDGVNHNWLWFLDLGGGNTYALLIHKTGRPYLETYVNSVSTNTYNSADPVLQVGTSYKLSVRGDGTNMALFIDGVKSAKGDVAYTEPIGALPANMYIGSKAGGNQANGIIDDLRIRNKPMTDQEIIDMHNSGAPFPVDEYTTAKFDFDGMIDGLSIQDVTQGSPDYLGNINGVAASTIQQNATNSVQQGVAYNSVKISSANGIQVLDETNTEVLKMGELDPVNNIYGFKAIHSDGSYTQMTPDGFKRFVPTPIYQTTPTGIPNKEDFESGVFPSDWERSPNYVSVTNVDKYSGTYSLRLGDNAHTGRYYARSFQYITQDNTTVSCYYKFTNGINAGLEIDGVSYAFIKDASNWQSLQVTVNKGWHVFEFWSYSKDIDSYANCYVDDIVFEQNPVERQIVGYSDKGYEYQYHIFIGSAATYGQYGYLTSVDNISDVIIQLPDEFKGKQFQVFLSLKGITQENPANYAEVYDLKLEVVNIDYQNATFRVKGYARHYGQYYNLFGVPVYSYYPTTKLEYYSYSLVGWSAYLYQGVSFTYFATY